MDKQERALKEMQHLRRRVKHLEALHRISEHLIKHHFSFYDNVLELAELIGKAMGTSHIFLGKAIYHSADFAEADFEFQVRTGVFDQEDIALSILAGKAQKALVALSMRDYAAFWKESLNTDYDGTIQSFLGVPLTIPHKYVWGVIGIAYDFDRIGAANEFEFADVAELLETIAYLTAYTIGDTEMFERWTESYGYPPT